jgi:hypothetical protein
LPVIGHVIVPPDWAAPFSGIGAEAVTGTAWFTAGTHDSAISTGRVEIIEVLLFFAFWLSPGHAEGIARALVLLTLVLRAEFDVSRLSRIGQVLMAPRPGHVATSCFSVFFIRWRS